MVQADKNEGKKSLMFAVWFCFINSTNISTVSKVLCESKFTLSDIPAHMESLSVHECENPCVSLLSCLNFAPASVCRQATEMDDEHDHIWRVRDRVAQRSSLTSLSLFTHIHTHLLQFGNNKVLTSRKTFLLVPPLSENIVRWPPRYLKYSFKFSSSCLLKPSVENVSHSKSPETNTGLAENSFTSINPQVLKPSSFPQDLFPRVLLRDTFQKENNKKRRMLEISAWSGFVWFLRFPEEVSCWVVLSDDQELNDFLLLLSACSLSLCSSSTGISCAHSLSLCVHTQGLSPSHCIGSLSLLSASHFLSHLLYCFSHF